MPGTPALPQGFETAGTACGIKVSGNPDMALFVSRVPCAAAGVFTQNRVVGAPVIVSRARVPAAGVRAVIINSGNSNACTGDRGIEDARSMTAQLAERLNTDPDAVLVCSTGVIGHFLPMDKVSRGIQEAFGKLGSGPENLEAAARAIMTTDTVPKISCRRLDIAGRTVTITGVAKGAAMIAPNMATMLSVVMTDAQVTSEFADRVLRQAVGQSFNRISVDGHTSTSDTVLLLANGAAAVAVVGDDAETRFQAALREVCEELARKIIRDAEGAGHFVTVDVQGLPTEEDARRVAKAVCESPLVKTAVAGNDPNWGRIVSAAGYAGIPFQEQDLSLIVNGVLLYESGRPIAFDEAKVSGSMKQGEVHIQLKFRLGGAAVTYWTCDLTAEYVRLNADYTT